MSEWFVEDEWNDLLEKAGIHSFTDALTFSQGKLLSNKSHSRTWLYQSNNIRFFVKQDTSTRIRATLRSLIRFKRPVAATQKERIKMAHLESLGFNMAQVIAYGSENRFGLPHTGVIITLPVPGRSIAELWKDPSISEVRRLEVKAIGLKTLQALQNHGCDWKADCKPEHIFVTEENEVSLIDVERMRFLRKSLSKSLCEKQRERFLKLLK